MEKVISYIPNSILKFELHTNQRVAIQSSNHLAPVIDLKLPVAEPYARLMGRWIVECKKNIIFMRETNATVRDDCIVVSFQEPQIGVDIHYAASDGGDDLHLQKVYRMDIYPREVGTIKMLLRNENAETVCQSESSDNITSPRMPTADAEAVRELREELEREKNTSTHLQEMISANLDEMLQAATGKKQILSTDNQTRLQTLEALNAEIQRLNKSVQEVDIQINEANRIIDDANRIIREKSHELELVQVQIDDLNAQKEWTDLDCDAAKQQLDELKAQMNLDRDTLTLQEDGQRLKHGTISKSLNEMEKEIEKVEKCIAWILKFRSEFNQVVENAVLSGDGTILSSDEAGGIGYGNGSAASPEDS